ncbi:MAG: hypothetical protein OXP07_10855, partial [Defluviicoccus sp.]|nr:hypothetical protein [Defluviicoccus sp.]
MTDVLIDTDLAGAMAETAAAVDETLGRELPEPDGPAAQLYEAMRYGALGGGKRLRGFLVRTGARLAGPPPRRPAAGGAAKDNVAPPNPGDLD